MRDAADELGVTVEAIRKRVQRRSIRSDKGKDGRRYVYLDTGRDTSDHKRPVEGSAELVDSLRDQVEYLRGQLEAERQAHAEARRIIGGLIERMPPQIEAPATEPPQDAPGPPQAGGGASSGGTTPGDRERPAQRPSWWRRFWR
jgi:hypothetical protein